jgi:heptosyltransferase-2
MRQSSWISPDVERILVAQTGFLGDVVLTTPLISAVKERFPASHLSVLVTPQARPLLEDHPDVDAVLVDDKRGENRGIRGLCRIAQELRRGRFTLALAAHKSLRTALLLLLAGIPYRVGFRQSKGWFLYHQTVVRDLWRHEVERILCLMRALGKEPEECAKKLCLTYNNQTEERADRLLRAGGVDGKGPLFAVCPGSVWPTKRWTAQGYAALVRRLAEGYGRPVLVCGSQEDGPLAQMVCDLAGGKGINLAGRADLKTFIALVDRLSVLITNDSAPMHIAVARGVPVVAIFCATTPSQGYGPYSEVAIVVEKDLACRPCDRHGGRTCPRGTEDCLRLVTVEEVLAGVKRVLVSSISSSRLSCQDQIEQMTR